MNERMKPLAVPEDQVRPIEVPKSPQNPDTSTFGRLSQSMNGMVFATSLLALIAAVEKSETWKEVAIRPEISAPLPKPNTPSSEAGEILEPKLAPAISVGEHDADDRVRHAANVQASQDTEPPKVAAEQVPTKIPEATPVVEIPGGFDLKAATKVPDICVSSPGTSQCLSALTSQFENLQKISERSVPAPSDSALVDANAPRDAVCNMTKDWLNKSTTDFKLILEEMVAHKDEWSPQLVETFKQVHDNLEIAATYMKSYGLDWIFGSPPSPDKPEDWIVFAEKHGNLGQHCAIVMNTIFSRMGKQVRDAQNELHARLLPDFWPFAEVIYKGLKKEDAKSREAALAFLRVIHGALEEKPQK